MLPFGRRELFRCHGRQPVIRPLCPQTIAAALTLLVLGAGWSHASLSNSWTSTTAAGATANLEWREISSAAQAGPAPTLPSARYGAAFADDPALGATLLFGGMWQYEISVYPYAIFEYLLNDTWTLSDGKWTNLTESGPSPPARWGASMAYDPALNGVVLFGGQTIVCRPLYCAIVTPLNDTWLFSDDHWTNVTSQSPLRPPARYQASMVYDPAEGALVLFGGIQQPDGQALNDTWELRGEAWSHVTDSRTPPARFGAAFGYDPQAGSTLLVGGSVYRGPSLVATTVPDAWSFSAGAWTNITATETPAVAATSALGFDLSANLTLLWGAYGTGVWSFQAGQWTAVRTLGSPPSRSEASFACDATLQGCILFGGIATSGNGITPVLGDAWLLTPSVNLPLSEIVVTALPVASAIAGALFVTYLTRARGRSKKGMDPH